MLIKEDRALLGAAQGFHVEPLNPPAHAPEVPLFCDLHCSSGGVTCRGSASGHLGCSHVLAVVNSAAMNTRVYVHCASVLSHFSHLQLFATRGLWPPPRLPCPWDSPGKNAGVGCHALLQGIFPTQRSSPFMSLTSPEWACGFFTTSTAWEACMYTTIYKTDN